MMANRCKVCGHKRVQEINKDLVEKWRSRLGFRKIATHWNVSVPSLYRHFCNDLPSELLRSEEARRELKAETLMAHLNKHYDRLQKLLAACEVVLQDPSDPTRWVVGSAPEVVAQCRAEDLTVYYQMLVNGKAVNRKSNLDILLKKIKAAGSKQEPVLVTGWQYRGEDVKRTARETARALKEYLSLAAQLTGMMKPDKVEIDTDALIRAVVDALRDFPLPLRRVIEKLRAAEVPLPSSN
jgi:hypothetical protein